MWVKSGGPLFAWMVLLQISMQVRGAQLKLALEGCRRSLGHEGRGDGDTHDPQGLCYVEGLQGKQIVDKQAATCCLLTSHLLSWLTYNPTCCDGLKSTLACDIGAITFE